MNRCNVEANTSNGVLEIHLSGSADVAAARDLQEALVSALSQEGEIAVSLAGLERLDGAGLQLLIAMQVWAKRAGRTLIFRSPSDVALRALQTGGALSILPIEANTDH